jgi:hypothetical protein
MDDLLPSFSVRQLQFYAGLCFRQFCLEKKIDHPAIDAFLKHLFSLASIESISEWPTNGAKLELTGLGDPLPDSLLAILPAALVEPFDHLSGNCIEVGMVDLWGAESDEPLRFVRRVIEILDRQGIATPDPRGLAAFRDGTHWGSAWNPAEFAAVERFFDL